MGAPGARGWQRPIEQRTRRWSKALGPRLSRNRTGGQPQERDGRERKGERARNAVNASAGNGTSGDAPRGKRNSFREPQLSAEGRLRRAAGASQGSPFRDGRKCGEPHDRQRPERGSQSHEGTNRRGGERPRGRHAEGSGSLFPKEANDGAETRRRTHPGRRTSRLGTMEGDLWTTAREETRLRSRVARTGMRRTSRRQGQEGRANQNESDGKRTGRGSSRTAAR